MTLAACRFLYQIQPPTQAAMSATPPTTPPTMAPTGVLLPLSESELGEPEVGVVVVVLPLLPVEPVVVAPPVLTTWEELELPWPAGVVPWAVACGQECDTGEAKNAE